MNSQNPFSPETLQKLSDSLQEPDWMKELRLLAWEAFKQHSKDRPKIFLDSLQAFCESPRESIPSEKWPRDLKHVVEERGDEEGLIIQRDSTILSRAMTKDQIKKGVIFTDLTTAVRQHSDLVKKYFAQQIRHEDPYSALSTAFWHGGSFLYVPQYVRVELPFHTCYWMTTPHSAVFPRTLIVLEKGAYVTFIDDYLSVDWDQEALAVSAVELFVAEQAKITYKQIHHWGKGVRHESRQMSSVEPSGYLECSQITAPRETMTLERVAELYPEVREANAVKE
jgi:Fe-S cluster assembly protein SufD